MKNVIATKIIKSRLRNILFALLILSAVFLPYGGGSLGQKSVAKAAGSTSLVISAIFITGADGDTTNQYVELHNPTTTAVTMTNWRLARKDSNGVESNLVSSLNGTISAGGYFFVTASGGSHILVPDAYGQSFLTPGDALYSDMSNLLKNDNTVLLYRDQGHTLVDKVGYGAAKDFETSPFPTNLGTNSILVRLPVVNLCQGKGDRNQDTNNNSRDFKLLGACDVNTSSSTLSSTTPTGDVFVTSEDGSWNPDHAIDFPNGKVSDEEQALYDKAQTVVRWWQNAFSKASINCPPAGHSAERRGVVYWDLRSIMKKACWITDITTLNLVTGNFVVTGHDSSLLDELYTTYWPDLASNRASGLFVGTQAWIGTALVNGLAGPGLVGPDGVTNPSPPTIDALVAVHDAGWGVEADRLLANFEAIQGRNGGLVYVPSVKPLFDNPVDAFIALSWFIPYSKIPVVGAFIFKVTKIPEILIMKSVGSLGTGFTYVVKVANAALARTLTNKVLANATRADLDTLVVKEVGKNLGSQATPAMVVKRVVNKTTNKVTGWEVLSKDAQAAKLEAWNQRKTISIGGKEMDTLMYQSSDSGIRLHVIMDASWKVPLQYDAYGVQYPGNVAVFDLTWMFRGTNLSFDTQRYIATKLAILLGTMFDNDVINQAVGKSPSLLNHITKGFVVDDSAYARELGAKGFGAWYDAVDKEIHIPLAALEKENFSLKFLNNYCAHETLHNINYAAMDHYGTKPPWTLYRTLSSHNPIEEGLTEWIAMNYGVDKSIGATSSYVFEVDTVDLLVTKLTHVYMNMNPTIGLDEARNLMAKNMVNAYIKYGSAAFDHIIETSAGKFSSKFLADELVFPRSANPLKWAIESDTYNYIKWLNITKINIIPPATF